MAKPDTLQTVTRVFRNGEKKYSCTNLEQVVLDLAKEINFPQLEIPIVHQARRISQPDHLYPGAYQLVKGLVNQGDWVTIWTQGHHTNQLFKIAGTKIGDIKKDLWHPERSRLSVYAEMDKIVNLKDPLNNLVQKGAERIFVVDDKAANVERVSQKVIDLKKQGEIPETLNITPIWARYGAYKDQAPKGWELDDFLKQVKTISDISELKQYALPDRLNGWLLDFDHTLMDTTRYNQELYAHVAHLIDGIEQALPARVGLSSGLTGRVKSASLMRHGGMSGSQITAVDTVDQKLVVKHHHNRPARVIRDIEGYHFLSETPLESIMPKIESYSKQDGYLILPHIDGKTLRELITQGDINQDFAISIYTQLLDLKKEWWGSQLKKSPIHYRSMQREEWTETRELIPIAIAKMAASFGISSESLWRLPLRVSGRKLPSLESMVSEISDQLNKLPPYVLGVHGDASGSNILVDQSSDKWYLIDAEWADFGDPAESFVRMAKHRSTTTANQTSVRGLGIYEEALGVNINGKFNQVADTLHQFVSKKSSEFGSLLQDPDFVSRFKRYMAGSYLRELALINKRGSYKDGLLAMVMAGECLSMPALNQIAA